MVARVRVCYYNCLLDMPWSAGVHARALVASWRAAGHEVLCLPHEPAAEGDATDAPRLTWLHPTVRAYAQDGRARLLAPRQASRYGALVRGFAPHVVIARRARYDVGLDRLLRDSRLPYVAEVNALVSEETRVLAGEKPPPWEYERERAFLRHAAGAQCVSRKVRDEAVAAGVARSATVVIPNGVDAGLFAPEAVPDAATEAWARRHRGVLGFTGSLSFTHDTGTMLAAAARVAERLPETGLLFVGPTLADLRAFPAWRPALEDRAHCTGRVPHGSVPGHLVSATALWASFLNDYGSPLKLYEYMALAKPVAIGGGGVQPAGVVTGSGCGAAVAARDPEALAAAAAALLSLPEEERRSMGERGRRHVLEHSTWSRVAEQFLTAAVAMTRASVSQKGA